MIQEVITSHLVLLVTITAYLTLKKLCNSYHDDYYYDDNSTSTATSTDTSEIENCIILGQGQIAMSVFLMLLAFVAYYVFYTAVRLVGWRAQNLNFILYKAKEEKK